MRIDSGCNSAQKGAARLAGLGVQVKEMLGGIEYWLHEGNDIEVAVSSNPLMVPVPPACRGVSPRDRRGTGFRCHRRGGW